MAANLPQICRSVPCKHESGINFPICSCVEGMEEILREKPLGGA
jgi:hypothetical protein